MKLLLTFHLSPFTFRFSPFSLPIHPPLHWATGLNIYFFTYPPTKLTFMNILLFLPGHYSSFRFIFAETIGAKCVSCFLRFFLGFKIKAVVNGYLFDATIFLFIFKIMEFSGLGISLVVGLFHRLTADLVWDNNITIIYRPSTRKKRPFIFVKLL